MKLEGDAFIKELKVSFEKRCQKNPRYSLRSFAKSLCISAGSLSRVMAGRRKPTLKMIEKIGPALGLKSNEIFNHQRDLLGMEPAEIHQKFNSISEDIFAIIADWYHLAILELMKLSDFKPDLRQLKP